MTGAVLEKIADDMGVDDFSRQIGLAVEHLRESGVEITAPLTSAPPSPISWA
jgi:hypothetical protein